MNDLIAKIYLFPYETSGRKKDIQSGYKAPLQIIETVLNDSVIKLINKQSLSPGETSEAYISFLYPNLVKPFIYSGKTFKIWENGFIGEGEIISVIDINEHINLLNKKDRIRNLLPKDKYDINNVELLKTYGFPKLNAVIFDLLCWIQDINWPIANSIISILKCAGNEIVPEIVKILHSNDKEWIFTIVKFLIPYLSIETQKELIPEIEIYLIKENEEEYKQIIIEYLNTYNDLTQKKFT
jgi:hypothetical protein